MTDQAPAVGYWHLWTDDDGTSHLTHRRFDQLTLTDVAKGAVPILVESMGTTDSGSIDIAVVRSGVVGEWHEDPRPLWGAVLTGCFFLEAMDGTRVELTSGDLFLGEDQGTRSPDGRRGHRSGAVGDDDVTLLMVPVHDPRRGST
jgi:hypothetical protein